MSRLSTDNKQVTMCKGSQRMRHERSAQHLNFPTVDSGGQQLNSTKQQLLVVEDRSYCKSTQPVYTILNGFLLATYRNDQIIYDKVLLSFPTRFLAYFSANRLIHNGGVFILNMFHNSDVLKSILRHILNWSTSFLSSRKRLFPATFNENSIVFAHGKDLTRSCNVINSCIAADRMHGLKFIVITI